MILLASFVGQLRTNWQSLLRIWLPFLVVTGCIVILTWANGEGGGPTSWVIFPLMLLALMMLCFAAVNWHRIYVQGRKIHAVGGHVHWAVVLKYVLDWFILSFLISLCVAVFFWGAYWLSSMFNALPAQISQVVIVTVLLGASTYFICRLGMGLVETALCDRAVWRGGLGIGDSWKLTRPDHRAILSAALISAFVIAVLFTIQFEVAYGQGGAFTSFAGLLNAAEFALQMLVVIIDLAMLSEVFRRVQQRGERAGFAFDRNA